LGSVTRRSVLGADSSNANADRRARSRAGAGSPPAGHVSRHRPGRLSGPNRQPPQGTGRVASRGANRGREETYRAAPKAGGNAGENGAAAGRSAQKAAGGRSRDGPTANPSGEVGSP